MKIRAFVVLPGKDEIEVKPLILCQDCIYCNEAVVASGKNYYFCSKNDHFVDLDGFCSYGERGEDSPI